MQVDLIADMSAEREMNELARKSLGGTPGSGPESPITIFPKVIWVIPAGKKYHSSSACGALDTARGFPSPSA